MSRFVFNSNEAVTRVAIRAAKINGVCDVSVHQHAKADDRFIAAMPRLERAGLEGDLPAVPACASCDTRPRSTISVSTSDRGGDNTATIAIVGRSVLPPGNGMTLVVLSLIS